ncbi:unnamed protein product, partial [Scytosiphon promiscuus]
MPSSTRRSWATRKVSSYLRADVAAGRLDDVEGRQQTDALVEELLRSYRGRCNSCSLDLVWAVYSERQPTIDRLDCALPHTPGNVDIKCLRCN